MICVRQGLRKYQYKYKDKDKYNDKTTNRPMMLYVFGKPFVPPHRKALDMQALETFAKLHQFHATCTTSSLFCGLFATLMLIKIAAQEQTAVCSC